MRRRRCVLASLWFAPESTAGVRGLARELDLSHNIAASADQVRGDLSWLAEQGFVRPAGDMAQATERGADVVRGAAPWPGE